jgi:hypothetical protein
MTSNVLHDNSVKSINDKYNDTRKKQSLRRRFETREFLIELKSQPCVDCGGSFHYCQMDFVPQVSSDEPVRISRFLTRSRKRIIEELSKKDLVCANCARMRIWKAQRAKRAGPV